MNKLFFFDIDGTLLACEKGIYEIQSQTENALDELKTKGHDVFLATGRCKCFIVDGVMKYPFEGYVTCNGAYVEYKGVNVYKKAVPKEAIEKTIKLCKERNLICYFESNDFIYAYNTQNEKHVIFKDKWAMKDNIIITGFSIDDIEVYIGMIVANSQEDIEPIIETLSPYFDIQQHLIGMSFDLTLKGESKAKGIRKLVELTGKSIEQTVAFGDGRNDVEMLSEVNLGIAMGNAAKEAKDVSKYITSNVDDNGIINALKHFKFIS